ncbi:MAG TPA: glycine--tRNA ligase subunit beta, partial [Acetobacteraceae bacterium]|nr:glycine--tRNA ligase subunit beta [Acetobacteraceae bacterium]
ADLTSGMVGEFPELQGIMGRYYALHDGEDQAVADAIRDHYLPRGASDDGPRTPVSVAVALADRTDLVVGMFCAGDKPTGSSDPYAVRRAALGIIRIIRDNGIRVPLRSVLKDALEAIRLLPVSDSDPLVSEVLAFIADRLRVQHRAEGARHDVLAAAFAASDDDDLVRLLARSDAIASLLRTEDGTNLLVAYRRAANILRIEERKDGPHDGAPDRDEFREPEERTLADALDAIEPAMAARLASEDFAGAMRDLAALRSPLDAFFDSVTVNDPDPDLRRNRLRLLARVRRVMNRVADFSKIEG